MLILIAIGSFMFTLVGGFLAVKFRDKLHLILGFSAGAVIGVALFDLIPESLAIGGRYWSDLTIMLVIALGFILYMILDRNSGHCDSDDDHTHRGRIGAGSLSLHSFLDGIAIGVSFGVSNITGLVVSSAVLAHDFSDGINTASMIMRHGGNKAKVFKWVLIDALAPVLGVLFTLLFTIPDKFSGLVMALFAGLFLYIGTGDLLPESHHKHPTKWTTISTVLGILFIYLVVYYARI